MSAAALGLRAPIAATRPRVQSVDILRGLVMIVMTLDHVRDFFHSGAEHFDPADLTQTTPMLFLTRWITHFCAPTFMFLAGTGAYLQVQRGKSTSELAYFLWTRGLWLVVLELTWVRWFGWRMNFGSDQIMLWVIWALGVSMIALAGLIFIPWRTLLTVSISVIVLHDAADGLAPSHFGEMGWLWRISHSAGVIEAGSTDISVSYPLIPWVFVMAAGYCFGRVIELESSQRRSLLLRLGGLLICAFVILRWLNFYGDPRPWSVQPTPLLTLASFLNCAKYPPSLLYLLMTLGPAITILGLLERVKLSGANPLTVFGRVPLFFYLLHIPLIHGLAIAMDWLRYGICCILLNNPPSLGGSTQGFPADYGYGLPIVYLVWVVVVATLYPACRWFADLKQRNRSVVLSYL